MTKQRVLWVCIGLMVLLGSNSQSALAESKGKKKSIVYELRTYTTAEGRLPALHKRFRDHTIELFKKHGMTNVIYWTPEEKDNTLVYLISHKNVEARNKSFDAFRKDPAWQKAYKDSIKDGKIVTKVESQFLNPTTYTPKTFAAQPGWIYELRTYTTNAGKLPNLNARFSDHTVKLFEKHGIKNVMYSTPVDKENMLVYVIAHKDRETADKSWKAFGQDPAWKKVAKESQLDGRILIKGGAKRQYLNTTDYSPNK
jgi:L-rhamnose mutarotase